MNYLISTNRKEVKFCCYPPIGPNKIVKQENHNNLGEIFASFFSGFKNRSQNMTN